LPPESKQRYRDRVPDRLCQYWDEHGLCGYHEGLLWIVDPAEYQYTLDTLLRGSPLQSKDEFCVIARTAFGDLRVWGRTIGKFTISVAHGILYPDRLPRPRLAPDKLDSALQAFFLTAINPRFADFADESGKPLFSRARKQLGPPTSDEIYGFEPAIALGGTAALAHLRRVKVIEHLELIAQLGAPLRILETPQLR
jgi:hypothetical protein